LDRGHPGPEWRIPMAMSLSALRHGKERLHGATVTALSAVIWLALLADVAFAVWKHGPHVLAAVVLQVGAIALFFRVAHLFTRAYMAGHYVVVSPQQFPRLHGAVADASARLGLATTPAVYLYNSNGLANAFARRMLGRRYVVLASAIVDTDSEAQLRFIAGHEVGHHAAGHMDFWGVLLRLPGMLVPFAGPAYSRARELTADRMGAYCAGRRDAARGALQMLACGSARLNPEMNLDAFQDQERTVPPVSGFLLDVMSPYPRTTRRVLEVDRFFREAAARRGAADAG